MVLAYIELAKILVVLLECIIIEMPKVGGAIAPPAPPVPAPLVIQNGSDENLKKNVYISNIKFMMWLDYASPKYPISWLQEGRDKNLNFYRLS